MCVPTSRRHPGIGISVILTLIITFFSPPTASAQYYSSVDTTNATTLRATLHEVIDDHERFPYTASTTDTWDILNLADEDPNDINRIVDIYKNASYAKISGGVGAYNREHSWPKSYGFPNDGADNSAYTDCHHLFASDVGYNAERSNRPFRQCNSGCVEHATDFTDGRGGGTGVYPGNSNWGTGDFTQGTWQTWSGRKGDVARALFYMDVRYEGGVHSGTGYSEPDLRLTDNESLIDQSNTGSNESVAYMGMLSVLLQWHVEDPVDARELYRNEIVYGFQGNRNPFIDNPDWALCIYQGTSCGGGGGGGGGNPAGDLILTEVLYDVSSTDDGWEWVEIYNRGTSTVDLSAWSLGNGGTSYTWSTVQLSGTLAPGQIFVVGGASSGSNNGNPSYDQIFNFNPDFQNSGSTADGVALFNVAASAITASTVPMDAVVYGSSNNSGLIDESGSANAPEVGDAGAGSSIERIDLAGSWQIQSSPTPNSTPFASPPTNTAPSASISTPNSGSVFVDGDTVSFAGGASDNEDGDLSASLVWSSNLDGQIGLGASFSSSSLSVGFHTLSISVTDSGGLSAGDSVSIEVQPAAGPTTVTFTSIASQDGWVRESSENSSVGSWINSGSTTTSALRIGDHKKDRQYLGIVSFDTSSLPAGATITAVTLRLKRGTVIGTNPFNGGFGQAEVDVQSGAFSGSTSLQTSDFEAAATAPGAGVLSNPSANGDWSEAVLDASGLAAINASGTTQLRFGFELGDNDDLGNDFVGFYSGDHSNSSNHPQLVVTYQ